MLKGFGTAGDLAKLSEGTHSDRKTSGLYCQVRGESRSWLFRWKTRGGEALVSRTGKAYRPSRIIGLGSVDLDNAATSLETARKLAGICRNLVAQGVDPLEHREKRRAEEAKKLRKVPTFREYASDYVKRREAEWKHKRHRQQWFNTLGLDGAGKRRMRYCDSLHALPIDKVDGDAIRKVLDPIWALKPETASRLRGRLERILDAAKADNLREGDNPAAWGGNLDTRYSPKGKLRDVQHHVALPWKEIPSFMAQLRKRKGTAPKCVEFIVLTATRSNEARGTKWDELDLEAKRWTIPGGRMGRMKKSKPHAVPLSEPAIELLKALPRVGKHVFPGLKRGTGISDTALRDVLRDMGISKDEASIHGMRSSFRDWAGETTSFPREVCEHALAHGIPDETEAAYFRSDLFTRRVELMAAWASFCAAPAAGNVLTFPQPVVA
jgi:integrase